MVVVDQGGITVKTPARNHTFKSKQLKKKQRAMKAEKQNEVLAELKAKLEAINNEPFSVDSIMQVAKKQVENALSWKAVKDSLIAIAKQEGDDFAESTRDELSKMGLKATSEKRFNGVYIKITDKSGYSTRYIKQHFEGDVKPLPGNGDYIENVRSSWMYRDKKYTTIMSAMNGADMQEFLCDEAVKHQYHVIKN